MLPRPLDETVARRHLAKLGVTLAQRSEAQAAHIGVTPQGPFRADHDRC